MLRVQSISSALILVPQYSAYLVGRKNCDVIFLISDLILLSWIHPSPPQISSAQILRSSNLHAPTIQGIHKRMVRIQKLTRNLFLTLHGHNVHRQQRQLSKFLMRYQQFASHAYCGASFQDGVAAGKGFLCAPFWGVQICDYSAAWVSCTV